MELLVPAGASRAAVAAMLAAHPYEEPAYVVLPAADVPRSTGIGRVGEVSSPMTLAEFGDLVAAALPATEHGVRVAGDLAGVVRRVAVCGGAGDSLMGDARAAGADVYVTADLRHHRVQGAPGRGRVCCGGRRALGERVALVPAGGRAVAAGAGRRDRGGAG